MGKQNEKKAEGQKNIQKSPVKKKATDAKGTKRREIGIPGLIILLVLVLVISSITQSKDKPDGRFRTVIFLYLFSTFCSAAVAVAYVPPLIVPMHRDIMVLSLFSPFSRLIKLSTTKAAFSIALIPKGLLFCHREPA